MAPRSKARAKSVEVEVVETETEAGTIHTVLDPDGNVESVESFIVEPIRTRWVSRSEVGGSPESQDELTGRMVFSDADEILGWASAQTMEARCITQYQAEEIDEAWAIIQPYLTDEVVNLAALVETFAEVNRTTPEDAHYRVVSEGIHSTCIDKDLVLSKTGFSSAHRVEMQIDTDLNPLAPQVIFTSIRSDKPAYIAGERVAMAVRYTPLTLMPPSVRNHETGELWPAKGSWYDVDGYSAVVRYYASLYEAAAARDELSAAIRQWRRLDHETKAAAVALLESQADEPDGYESEEAFVARMARIAAAKAKPANSMDAPF